MATRHRRRPIVFDPVAQAYVKARHKAWPPNEENHFFTVNCRRTRLGYEVRNCHGGLMNIYSKRGLIEMTSIMERREFGSCAPEEICNRVQ